MMMRSETHVIMGMPITITIADSVETKSITLRVFDYFHAIDERFSTYKTNSEISQINRGELPMSEWSMDMRRVIDLAEQTRRETGGYFNIRRPDGVIDPSGIVKGWAIQQAAAILIAAGLKNFLIDAGGDIHSSGVPDAGGIWRVGIKNPFNQKEIVKVIGLSGQAIATSGIYIRGQHIYDPVNHRSEIHDIVSISVLGPTIYDADRFATAAFAMGTKGIEFIENLAGYEGYSINTHGRATMTSGFERYIISNA